MPLSLACREHKLSSYLSRKPVKGALIYRTPPGPQDVGGGPFHQEQVPEVDLIMLLIGKQGILSEEEQTLRTIGERKTERPSE